MEVDIHSLSKIKVSMLKSNLKIHYFVLAIGLNDFAGTGIYASEYLVSSYKINNFDFTLGIGWGNLAGSATFKNPFKIISDSFGERRLASGEGGEFNFDSYFAGEEAAFFGGLNYTINNKVNLKAEYDPTITPG